MHRPATREQQPTKSVVLLTLCLAVFTINLGDLNDAFKSGDKVTPEALAEAKIVKGTYDELKILGDGEITKKLKISAHRFSKTAAEKIAAAGGEAIVLPGKAPVVKNKKKAKEGSKSTTSKG